MDTREIINNLRSESLSNVPLWGAHPCTSELILAIGREVYELEKVKEEVQKEYLKSKNAFEIFEDDNNPRNWSIDKWKANSETARMIYGHIEFALEKEKKLYNPVLPSYMQETAEILAEIKSAMLDVIKNDDYYALGQLLSLQDKLCYEWVKEACRDEP